MCPGTDYQVEAAGLEASCRRDMLRAYALLYERLSKAAPKDQAVDRKAMA